MKTRCQCRGLHNHTHAFTDTSKMRDDFRCPNEATVFVSTGSNPIKDVGMCKFCAQWRDKQKQKGD